MTRLPIPGSDDGTWGNILNDFLAKSHNADGSLKTNSVGAAALADNTVTNTAISASADIDQSKIHNLTSDLSAKAPLPAQPSRAPLPFQRQAMPLMPAPRPMLTARPLQVRLTPMDRPKARSSLPVISPAQLPLRRSARSRALTCPLRLQRPARY